VAVRLRALLVALLVACSALLLAVPALAQAAESVGGALRDGEGEPVAGVSIEVADADGNVIEDGRDRRRRRVAGRAARAGEYVITLDDGTLPDGVELRNAENNPLEITVRSGQNRSVIFALGEGAAGATSCPSCSSAR
jgi:neutral amino acid transport system permease protein